ncbi:phage holin family protein [Streptomyces sp. NPDC003077]|uniref:phage holin family protein n=1 Tax=Streptomyces sp. NPDC003077 TaxID=3154443 RepID=UPI0033B86D8C
MTEKKITEQSFAGRNDGSRRSAAGGGHSGAARERPDTARPGTFVRDLAEPVAEVVREELRHEIAVVREELRAQIRQEARRRALRMYGGAMAAALYGAGTFTAFLVLAAGLALPAWAAALVVAIVLGLLAVILRNAARQRRTRGRMRRRGPQETPAPDEVPAAPRHWTSPGTGPSAPGASGGAAVPGPGMSVPDGVQGWGLRRETR